MPGCQTRRITAEGFEVGCGVCKQCLKNRVRDLIGRSIAESKVSWGWDAVTLTYGRSNGYLDGDIDHVKAQILAKKDVDRYLGRLRYYTNGGLRYLFAGENGTKRGRGHWHLILFWRNNRPPNIKYETNEFIHVSDDGGQIWPHGFSYWRRGEPGDYESIGYACKYVLKQYGSQIYGYSSQPPLGDGYFINLARRHVMARLSPQNTEYHFDDVKHPKTKTPYSYFMTSTSLYNFLSEFDRMWQQKYKNQDWPQSDVMDKYVEERDRRERRTLGIPDEDTTTTVAKFRLEQAEKDSFRNKRKIEWPSGPEGSLVRARTAQELADRINDTRKRLLTVAPIVSRDP